MKKKTHGGTCVRKMYQVSSKTTQVITVTNINLLIRRTFFLCDKIGQEEKKTVNNITYPLFPDGSTAISRPCGHR